MLKDNQPETAAGGPQVQAVDKGHIIPDERRAERSVPSGAAQRPRYEKLPSSYAEALRLGGSQGESRSSDTRNLSRSQSSSGPLSGAGASERQSCTTQKIEGETLPHKEPRKDKGSSAGEAGVDHEHLNHPEQCHENPVTSRIDDIAENSNPNSTAVTVGESGIAEVHTFCRSFI
ncbi:hypothetical protein BDZ91DRAFT_544892 [Kalaharituber pfeilii]|nr:hypothetical protein BDZ91DRAFT_544892 [Kalaharituber pfeilii]